MAVKVLHEVIAGAFPGRGVHRVTFSLEDHAGPGADQARRVLHQCVEDRPQVERGSGYDLEDLCGRGLLLQCLLGFVEQAHVLDRDHRLVGEGLDETDLPLVEGPDFAAPGGDDADERGVPQHRHGENGPHVFAFVEVARRR
jgi:hypothetical protein